MEAETASGPGRRCPRRIDHEAAYRKFSDRDGRGPEVSLSDRATDRCCTHQGAAVDESRAGRRRASTLGCGRRRDPPEASQAEAAKRARSLADGAAGALWQIKELCNTADNHDQNSRLKREREATLASASSADARGGVRAFVETCVTPRYDHHRLTCPPCRGVDGAVMATSSAQNNCPNPVAGR